MIYIFWSCREKSEAKRIINELLALRLIACASFFPVESIYRWESAIEESAEIKVLLKTLPKHFDAIQEHIQAHSSYEIPEIVQINITRTNSLYLSWLTQELQ